MSTGSNVKILWVQDEYDGPMNGVAEYNGEQVWFSRFNTPPIVSSTEVPVPYVAPEEVSAPEAQRSYTLQRIDSATMQLATENHIQHCAETGAPVNHGDPIKIRKRPQAVRVETDVAKTMSEGKEETIKAEKRAMGKFTHFKHQIVPGNIYGEFITVIEESDFSNYLVPRKVEVVQE